MERVSTTTNSVKSNTLEEIFSIAEKLAPQNQEKLLELATLYLESQQQPKN